MFHKTLGHTPGAHFSKFLISSLLNPWKYLKIKKKADPCSVANMGFRNHGVQMNNSLIKKISIAAALCLIVIGGFAFRKKAAQSAVEQKFANERTRLGKLALNYDEQNKIVEAQFKQLPALPITQIRENINSKMLLPMQQTLAEVQQQPFGWHVGEPLHIDYLAIFGRVAAARSLEVTIDLLIKMDGLQKDRAAGKTNAALMSNAVAGNVLPLLQNGFGELKNLLDSANLDEIERKAIEGHLAGMNNDLRHTLMTQMLALEEYSAYSTVYADTQKYFALKKASIAARRNLSLPFLQGDFASHVQNMNRRLQGVLPYFAGLTPAEVAPLRKEIQNSTNKVLLLTQAELDNEADARFLQFQKQWAVVKKKGGKGLASFNPKSVLPPSAIGGEDRVPASESTKLHHSLRALRLAREGVMAEIEMRLKSPHPDLSKSFVDWAKISRSPLKLSIEASVRKLTPPSKG